MNGSPVKTTLEMIEAVEEFNKHSIIHFLTEKFVKWQIPKESDIHIVAAIPKTSVGKFDKKVLRAQLRGDL